MRSRPPKALVASTRSAGVSVEPPYRSKLKVTKGKGEGVAEGVGLFEAPLEGERDTEGVGLEEAGRFKFTVK